MKRVLCILVAVLLLATSLTFAEGKKETPKKQLTFAYMSGILDPFMIMIEKGAAAKAKELGVKLMTAEYPKTWGRRSPGPHPGSPGGQGRVRLPPRGPDLRRRP